MMWARFRVGGIQRVGLNWSMHLRYLSNGGGGSGRGASTTTTTTEPRVISVDTSGLRQPPIATAPSSGNICPKSPRTPLLDELEMLIKMRGAISVADFMSHALGHPKHGYYKRAASRTGIFGEGGDFITAPEISQVFGELVGVWMVAMWMSLGSPSRFHLVELGPGRGTLMRDVLRAAQSFPEFHDGARVHMVETSRELRNVQRKTLEATYLSGAVPREGDVEAGGGRAGGRKAKKKRKGGGPGGSGGGGDGGKMRLPPRPKGGAGPVCQWHDSFGEVEIDGPVLLVAHELLDALPVHQFEFIQGKEEDGEATAVILGADGRPVPPGRRQSPPSTVAAVGGWRERLVDIDDGPSGEHHLRFVLSTSETPASRTLLRHEATTIPRDGDGDGDGGVKPGDRIEVCPSGIALVEDVAAKLAEHTGAALFVDYGENHALPESLRGIKDHEFVHALSQPGEVDLSIDVDFAALRRAVERVTAAAGQGVEGKQQHAVSIGGPLGQGGFLTAMGIQDRLIALVEADSTTEEQANDMFAAYKRLVLPEEMGEKYKVLALWGGTKDKNAPVAGGF